MKIKKGDTVIVIAGKDRGKQGTVARTLPQQEKVVVEGVAVVKKHHRARKRGSRGQVTEKPMPIHVSNVAVADPATGARGRIGYRFEGEGKEKKKVRIVRPSGTALSS